MEVWVGLMSAAVQGEGFPAPFPEYVFHPQRKFRFDLAWPTLKVAFEKEGLAKRGGKSRHTTNDGYSKDAEKYNEAALLGWLVIRATTRQIESGQALDWLLTALRGRAATSSP